MANDGIKRNSTEERGRSVMRDCKGGRTPNAVVHVAGGKYTFNVDKLDGEKLKQILEQIRSEVRPNG
jgi:hypothetical protein